MNAFEAVWGDIGGDVLVGNLFVRAHHLEIERGEKILVLVTHHEESVTQSAVGIGLDIDESERGGRFGELCDVGFRTSHHRSAVFDPGAAHVEIGSAPRIHFEHLWKGMSPHDVEIFFGQLWIGLRIEKDVGQQNVTGILQSRSKACILVGGSLEGVYLLQHRGGGIGPDIFFQFFECLLRGIAFGVGEGSVKGDHAGSGGAQLIH